MSTAGYLQDAKNQQKRLAETITAKGITATATEKYKDLVDKVAQIENLKGEERTLENFTNVLSEPKSVVQLKYPDNTPKTLNAKLGSKNLWQNTNTKFPATLSYDSSTQTYTLSTGTAGVIFDAHTLTNPIPVGTTVTISIMFQSGKGRGVAIGGYHRTGGTSWQGYISVPFGVDMTGQTLTSTFTTTETVEEFMVFHNTGDNIENPFIFQVQYELGSTATPYTPFISDFSTVNVTGCGKNLIPYPYTDTTKTISGVTFTVNSDGSVTVSGTATAQAYFKLQQPFSLKKGQYFFSGCPTGGAGRTYSLYLSTSDYKFYKADTGNGISINSEDDKTVSIVINISKDTIVNNLVFKPQLELGSTATSYEPYQGQTYTPTASGEVTGITNLYPTTTLLTDNAGVLFEQVTGETYKEILPSTDKNGITKVYQPSVDSTIDSNIKPENIKKGITILGVTGTYEPTA